ncbi:cysteine-rich CWC family protein [Aquabacterium sp.]|uniref:cysteine-rich CWC family protein n=1 Tax=Aquabacterium sp. TaxID=1872578 RepID=UPI0039B755BF
MNDVRPSPHLCPLCGQPNACGRVADGPAGGPSCWCSELTFSPALLARVPEGQRKLHCICETCARGALRTPETNKAT